MCSLQECLDLEVSKPLQQSGSRGTQLLGVLQLVSQQCSALCSPANLLPCSVADWLLGLLSGTPDML